MDHEDHAPKSGSGLLRDAIIALAAVAVAWLALDDITTDTAGGFPLERIALLGCAAWFVVVAWRLVQQQRRILGVLSLGLAAAGALAQWAIGPGTVPSVRFEYLATVGGLAWFVMMAAILAATRRATASA